MPSAAVVIIGDEILTGKFADENGPFLIARLRQLGCDLVRLVVIGDRIDEIADEVRRCSLLADHVITTGGVGPTHDDRTLEGIGAAFGLPLETREELAALLDRFGLPRNETNLRMATIPRGAELVVSRSSYPVVRVNNVWIFPGVPRLLQVKFEEIAARFAGEQVCCERVYTDRHETDIAPLLFRVQAAHPTVNIGSYPRFGEEAFRVLLTLEARDPEAVARAAAALRAALSQVGPGAG